MALISDILNVPRKKECKMNMVEMYRALGVVGNDIEECRELADAKINSLIEQRNAYHEAAKRKKNLIAEVRKQLASAKDLETKVELLISIDEMTSEYMQLTSEERWLHDTLQNLQIAVHTEKISDLTFKNLELEIQLHEMFE